MFGGYDSYNYLSEMKGLYSKPRIFRKGLSLFFSALAIFNEYPSKNKFKAMSNICNEKNVESAFKGLFYFPFNDSEKKSMGLLSEGKDNFDNILESSSSLEEAAQRYYFEEWLPNDLLMKVDKMSMAHGLEVRAPFLDKDLIDYFAGLPYSDKHNKRLFKQTIAPYLPREIIERKKQGFTVPLYEWFNDNKTRKRVIPFLQRLANRGIFKKEVIEELVSDTSFKSEHKIWVLLNLEIWFEIFVDKIPYKKIKL